MSRSGLGFSELGLCELRLLFLELLRCPRLVSSSSHPIPSIPRLLPLVSSSLSSSELVYGPIPSDTGNGCLLCRRCDLGAIPKIY